MNQASETGDYVDGEVRKVNERIAELRNRTFWSRLNWLLTGR